MKDMLERLEPQPVSWMAVQGSDDFSRLTDPPSVPPISRNTWLAM